MAFGDISPDAVLAAIQIPPDTPGLAVAGDSSGGWARIRTPHTSLRDAVNICNAYADRTPDLPALAAFRPAVAVAWPRPSSPLKAPSRHGLTLPSPPVGATASRHVPTPPCRIAESPNWWSP